MIFKAVNPDCTFTISTIKREFPPNAITATSRDNERNTCPVHANIRRIVRALNNVFRKNNVALLPFSCRLLCTLVMCSSDSASSEEPISWVDSCILSKCKHCPALEIVYPSELGVKEVKFTMWERQKVMVTKTNNKTKKVSTFEKKVFTLYPKTLSLDESVEKLMSILPNLKLHIYTAHKQWKAHEILRSNLVPGSIITIEDYQMNLEVSYGEAPTSQAYSTKKVSVAMYPLCGISGSAFQRGIVKKDEGIADLSEVIELIKSELNVSTKKNQFLQSC